MIELALLFAGRLEVQKGVRILAKSMQILSEKELSVSLDILGKGGLAEECMTLAQELNGRTRVRQLGVVAYGPPLFQLIRNYHALVLPNISDEQPRIVYDAYSQAVPILGTQTKGLLDCVIENSTGWLVEPNNPQAFSELIERAAKNLPQLRRMGMEALRKARSMSHQQMHRERQKLLLQFDKNL